MKADRRGIDDEDGDYRRSRYDREDPLQRIKRTTIALADSALVKIEDAVQSVATDFVGIFDNDEYREGYLSTLHDLYVRALFPIGESPRPSKG